LLNKRTSEGYVGTILQLYKRLTLATYQFIGLLAELKFELATNGELFPHVFGKLNKSAIVEIEKLT
jgi:uncharacterized protein (DUF952 family)